MLASCPPACCLPPACLHAVQAAARNPTACAPLRAAGGGRGFRVPGTGQSPHGCVSGWRGLAGGRQRGRAAAPWLAEPRTAGRPWRVYTPVVCRAGLPDSTVEVRFRDLTVQGRQVSEEPCEGGGAGIRRGTRAAGAEQWLLGRVRGVCARARGPRHTVHCPHSLPPHASRAALQVVVGSGGGSGLTTTLAQVLVRGTLELSQRWGGSRMSCAWREG